MSTNTTVTVKLDLLEKAAYFVGLEKQAAGSMDRPEIAARYHGSVYGAEKTADERSTRATKHVINACASCLLRYECPINKESAPNELFVTARLQDPQVRTSFRDHIRLAKKKGKDILCSDAMKKGRVPADKFR